MRKLRPQRKWALGLVLRSARALPAYGCRYVESTYGRGSRSPFACPLIETRKEPSVTSHCVARKTGAAHADSMLRVHIGLIVDSAKTCNDFAKPLDAWLRHAVHSRRNVVC